MQTTHDSHYRDDRLLTPAEVAWRFRVDTKTVRRWALAGKLISIKTPGGHRRYRESEVEKFFAAWHRVSGGEGN